MEATRDDYDNEISKEMEDDNDNIEDYGIRSQFSIALSDISEIDVGIMSMPSMRLPEETKVETRERVIEDNMVSKPTIAPSPNVIIASQPALPILQGNHTFNMFQMMIRVNPEIMSDPYNKKIYDDFINETATTIITAYIKGATNQLNIDNMIAILQVCNNPTTLDTRHSYESSLHCASTHGHLEIVRLLIEKGVDIYIQEMSFGHLPLDLASKHGHLETVRLLIDKGAKVNPALSNNLFTTPLHCASKYGHLEIVRLLIEKGANVSIRTNSGSTPLHSVSDAQYINSMLDSRHTEYFEIAKLLIENGANPNARDKYGSTPLHSSQFKHLNITRLLIDKGADVNAMDYSYGYTPLHRASMCNNLETVKLLIENGADASIQDKSGHTPIYYTKTYDPTYSSKSREQKRDPVHYATVCATVHEIKNILTKSQPATGKRKWW